MSDEDWRRLQRAWEATPGDQECLSALLAARRRAGVPITRALLDARRFPARTFRCALPYGVTVSTQPGVEDLRTPVDGGVELPEHTRWSLRFLRPLPHEGALGALLFELDQQDLQGLHLNGPGLSDAGIAELASTNLPGLEMLRLEQGEFGAAGLAALADLPDLIELELIAVGKVDDEALKALRSARGLLRLELGQLALDGSGLAALTSSGLAELEVWGCSLSPEGLDAIGSIASLRELKLQGTVLADEIVAGFAAGLPLLGRLHLGETAMLTDASLHACGRLGRLEHLRLADMPRVTDAGLAVLAGLPLRSLHVMAEQAGDETLRALSERTPALEALSTWGRRITSDGLRCLAGLTKLRELGLAFLGNEAGDDGFAALRALVELVDLNLFSCLGLTTTGLPFVRDLPALRRLSISHADVLHDDGPQALAGLPLTHLTLTSVEGLHDDALAPIRTLSELEVLRVTGCSTVDGSWLEHLDQLPQLRDLDLSVCPHLDPEQLAHLVRAPQLEALDLSRSESITDDALAVLPRLSQLEDLTLDACLGLTDAALEHLGRCSQLKTLSIDACLGLSDEGLHHLRGLSNLQVLFLSGGGITPLGIEMLRRALPGCDVISRFEV